MKEGAHPAKVVAEDRFSGDIDLVHSQHKSTRTPTETLVYQIGYADASI